MTLSLVCVPPHTGYLPIVEVSGFRTRSAGRMLEWKGAQTAQQRCLAGTSLPDLIGFEVDVITYRYDNAIKKRGFKQETIL